MPFSEGHCGGYGKEVREMKYHLKNVSTNKAICGSVGTRSDTFIYDQKGFESHFAKEHKCKRCQKILDSLPKAPARAVGEDLE